jgi:hypothetical protein
MLGWIVSRYRRDAAAQGKPQPIQHWAFDEILTEHGLMFLSAWLLVKHYMEFYNDDQQIIKRYPHG